MTTKTPAWFDEIHRAMSLMSRGSQRVKQLEVMSRLGKVFITTAIIKGKPARVRIWKP